MNDLLQDPGFFYAVAFIAFVALAFIYGRRPALGWIDSEIDKIRIELDQARELRTEAEATLAECQARQVASETEAKAIIAYAQSRIDAMRQRAAEELALSTERRKALVAENIRLAETRAIAEVRETAIDMAVALAQKTLSQNLSENDASRLIDRAISDLPACLPVKSKAA